MLLHHPFRFFNTIAVDKLVEGTAIGIIDELTQIGSIQRQHTPYIHQLELRMKVGLLLLHPLLEQKTVITVRS